MFGGARDKWTTLLTNIDEFQALALTCDKKHAPRGPDGALHKPWGLTHQGGWGFATAEEAQYPRGLCQAIAKILAKKLYKYVTPLDSQSSDDEAEREKKSTSARKLWGTAKSGISRTDSGIQDGQGDCALKPV